MIPASPLQQGVPQLRPRRTLREISHRKDNIQRRRESNNRIQRPPPTFIDSEYP